MRFIFDISHYSNQKHFICKSSLIWCAQELAENYCHRIVNARDSEVRRRENEELVCLGFLSGAHDFSHRVINL